MTCSTCSEWNPRKNKPMAAHHLAVCNLGPLWVFMPPTGKCSQHKQAEAKVVEQRVKWLEKAA